MDFILVRTKGRRATFLKVVSDKTLYQEIPSFTDTRPYNDEINLRDEQWFVLENFTQKEYAPQILRKVFNAVEWGQISRNDYNNIDYLLSVQDEGNLYIFQNITSSLVYKRQSWISLDEQPTLLNKEHLLVIHDIADAYYLRNDDCLYFKRLSSITGIFKGINELYNEATEEEVTTLLQMDILNVAEDFTEEKVKTANRRKIREAMDMYENYTQEQKEQLPQYLRKYCPRLDFTDGKFGINDEKSLTQLLNGLCQRYYTTEISKEKKVALSTVEV